MIKLTNADGHGSVYLEPGHIRAMQRIGPVSLGEFSRPERTQVFFWTGSEMNNMVFMVQETPDEIKAMIDEETNDD